MRNIWDEFVSISNNGTIFHKQSFLAYHIERKFTNHSLLFYNVNKLICVFPAIESMLCKEKILHSHPGASFGGLVVRDGVTFSMCNRILDALESYCKKQKIKSIIMINAPLIYYKKRDESLNYLLSWKNYDIEERYISHYVSLSSIKNLKQLLNKRKQRYLKDILIKKEFNIVPSNNFNAFYDLLVSAKKEFKIKPTHSLDELKKLQQLFPGSIKLLVSKKNNIVAGGVVLFVANKKTCLVFYNVVKQQYKKSNLALLQLYNIMTIAKQQKYQTLDFGVSHSPSSSNPYNPKFSLINFKEQLGARGVMRIVYKKNLNE